jgi:ubiquinone/menaquinone biosynthesis C-methylase UbiE
MDQNANTVIRCPECKSELDWEACRCSACSRAFSIDRGIVDFTTGGELEKQHQAEIDLHEELSGEYDKRYSSDFSEVYSRYWNRQFLEHLPADAGYILDCGCGDGDLARDLCLKGQHVYAMDISKAMLLQGKARLGGIENIEWVACPGEKMPFPSGIFDVVCFRGSLHHMAHERAALAEACRVLKTGGTLLLSEPNDDSILLRLPRSIVNRRMARFGNDHKAFRSRPWLKAIEAAGFRINATKYFSFLSQPLCGMSDLLPIMRWIPAAEAVARGLVAFDEVCSKIPLIRSQSFDLFVAASKTEGGEHDSS